MHQYQVNPSPHAPSRDLALTTEEFRTEIERFNEFGKKTTIIELPDPSSGIPAFVNEFWTSKQRAAHSLHEISYRACFKPQLPRFFIRRLTKPGDFVYDPFMGRGTTIVEAALLERCPIGCDVNPLSRILVEPRLDPPELNEISDRLNTLDLGQPINTREDLLAFYHATTLQTITNLRCYLLDKAQSPGLDRIDRWIRMVATNRLTGHSSGFFSAYTLPPNLAVSVKSQLRINKTRQQIPPLRDVRTLILNKSHSLLTKLRAHEVRTLESASRQSVLLTGSCDHTTALKNASVQLVVTSPPFLDTVDYQTDNWLRCWFNGIDSSTIKIWKLASPTSWQEKMKAVFLELQRVLVQDGYIAFEVGEVRGGRILLEDLVIPAAVDAGLTPLMVLINDQMFTKTSNCWGVDNLKKGTNTNRIVLLRKIA